MSSRTGRPAREEGSRRAYDATMDPCLPLRAVIATLLAALLAGSQASAQVFGDDFANTTPGTYWQSVSGNPALAITETAGRLQYSSTQSTSVAAMAFAGYASAN